MLLVTADADNVCVAQFPTGKTRMVVSSAAIAHPTYFSQTFLEAAPARQIWTRLATPIHAACVAIDGRGVLLCGDSGAGKTSLSYACARAGWQFISDDSSYLLHERDRPPGAGRLSPGALPSVGRGALPGNLRRGDYAAGVWKALHRISHFELADDQCDEQRPRRLHRFSQPPPTGCRGSDPVPQGCGALLYAPEPVWDEANEIGQYAAIERLMKAEVLELRYQSLDWAVGRLERLVREGH